MDSAACMMEKAILANPSYAEAYNNLGVLHQDAGSILLVINTHERCLLIDPDSPNLSQNRLLAMNYIHEGDDDKLYNAHVQTDAKTRRFKDTMLSNGGTWRYPRGA